MSASSPLAPLARLAMLAIACALFCSPRATARASSLEELVRVEAAVSALSGGSVYLDRGRAAGLATGDRVTFPGPTAAEGIVRAVSRSSSRVEMLAGSDAPAIGARAEIEVPAERLRAPEPAPSARPPRDDRAPQDAPPAPASAPPRTPTDAASSAPPAAPPAHPQWTHPPENWNDELPLLAKALGVEPEDRARAWSGRAYLRWNATTDERGGGRSYHLGTLGFDGRLENPFGRGGALEIDAAAYERVVDLSDGDDSDTRPLLRRLSYAFGGTEDDRDRVEIGRFLHDEFPELGVVDGVEWTRRYGTGASRFGFSAGGLPEPFPSMRSFESVGVALDHRWVPDEDERLSVGTAYQNTWFRGEQDRNLFLATLDWKASRDLSLHGSAWVDWYGPGDEVKEGFELTELRASATRRIGSTSGIGLSLVHVRWPELLRREFRSVTPEQLEENEVERLSLSGWHAFAPRVRANARVDGWRDQDDAGTNAEVGVAVRDWLWDEGEVGASAFWADGTYSSGPGLRLSATKGFERASANVAWQIVDYEQKGFVGEQGSLAHHSIFAGLDFEIGERWDLSLLGDWRFGDELEGYGIGLTLQARF